MNNNISHVSLFAGMGGFVVGLNRLGVNTLLVNDIEIDCIKTLNQSSLGGTSIGRSICDSSWYCLADSENPIDIVSGGFPCQPFSIAGYQEGFDDAERGNLFYDMMNFIKSLKFAPKVLFLENVTNLRNHNDGQWMAQIIEGIRDAGYWVSDKNCIVINSSDVSGTPQQRERLYVIAYHSQYFRRNYFHIDVSKGSINKKGLWEYVDRSIKNDDRLYLDPENKHSIMISEEASLVGEDRLFQIRRGSVRAVRQHVCPTLTANMGAGGHNVPFVIDDYGIRRLTVEECLSLQGYAEGEVVFPEGLSDANKLRMIGNSVNPDVIELIGMRIVEDIKAYANRLAISA